MALRRVRENESDLLRQFLIRLASSTPSEICQHDAPCCESAVAWFRVMAGDRLSPAEAMAWIHGRWRWGLLAWPQHWCQIVRADRIDCGALAALGRAALSILGEEPYPVQLIERFDMSTTENWRSASMESVGSADWLFGPFTYHEALAVERANELLIWDPTDSREVGETGHGYGAIVALRVHAPADRNLRWRGEVIVGSEWQQTDSACS